jgi:putative ABC transport system permease protein
VQAEIQGAFRDGAEAAWQAVGTLRAHPLRTSLGTLAILVAVATVASVITVLDGVKRFARESAERAFGSETFVVAQIASTGRVSRRELERKLQRNPVIRRADLKFLDKHASGLVIYAPSVLRNASVSAEGRTYDYAAVTGTTAELSRIRDLGIVAGRFFGKDEESRAAQVAVIGADIVDTVFPGRDPLGQTIRVAGRGFEVVGIQGRLGSSGGASLDRSVWIPLLAFERAFGPPATLQIFARPVRAGATTPAEDHARATLRARRGLGPGIEDTFDILLPEAARGFVQQISSRIGIAAVPIAVMALLAAVVVVTNTVLVSVSQRTREIGVRRALGARRRQLMFEVFAESGLVAIAGGSLALILVWLLTGVLSKLTGFGLTLAPSTAFWSLFSASVAGIVAGWYPARRAVRIDIIAALRNE